MKSKKVFEFCYVKLKELHHYKNPGIINAVIIDNDNNEKVVSYNDIERVL